MTENRKAPSQAREKVRENVKEKMIQTRFTEDVTFGQAVVTHHFLNQSANTTSLNQTDTREKVRSRSPQKEVISQMSDKPVSLNHSRVVQFDMVQSVKHPIRNKENELRFKSVKEGLTWADPDTDVKKIVSREQYNAE
jgi:hypothetical protein